MVYGRLVWGCAVSLYVRYARILKGRRTGGAFEVLCDRVSIAVSQYVRKPMQATALLGHDILFLKNSLTSFALNSRTGTWCSGAALCVPGAVLPLPPQALLPAAGVVLSLVPVGVLAPEFRSWFLPVRRQLPFFSYCVPPCISGSSYRFSAAPLIVAMVKLERGAVVEI